MVDKEWLDAPISFDFLMDSHRPVQAIKDKIKKLVF
jgi:hypothetical protein